MAWLEKGGYQFANDLMILNHQIDCVLANIVKNIYLGTMKKHKKMQLQNVSETVRYLTASLKMYQDRGIFRC